MALPFVPRIIYGSGPTTLNLTLPQKLWTPRAKAVGGKNVSDAGVLEAYVIRRDQMVNVEIRFYEAEWAAVDTWLDFAQTGQSFTYQFDKTNGATAYTVYLESPDAGSGEISPSRDSFGKVFMLPLTLRSTTGVRFTTLAF